MTAHRYPEWSTRECQRILDEVAQRLLDEHLAECADGGGEYHYTPISGKSGEQTCDRCGGTFVIPDA
jgi:hypothetical protein